MEKYNDGEREGRVDDEAPFTMVTVIVKSLQAELYTFTLYLLLSGTLSASAQSVLATGAFIGHRCKLPFPDGCESLHDALFNLSLRWGEKEEVGIAACNEGRGFLVFSRDRSL